MVILRDILTALGQAFLSLVRFFAESTAAAGIEIDPLIMAAIVVVVLLLLGSATWSCSIACSRRHSASLHFLLGLLLPYVYPLVIMFAMDIKGAKEREKQLREQEERERAEAMERERIAEMLGREQQEEGKEEERIFDADYFESIARDEQGNPTGPWHIVFGEQEIKALRILEPLPEVLSVEIEGRDGKPQKFRIPYARITECEPC